MYLKNDHIYKVVLVKMFICVLNCNAKTLIPFQMLYRHKSLNSEVR